MKGPNDLDGLSNDEQRSARKLEKEIEENFRGGSDAYEFNPHSIGAGDYTERVKLEVIERARKAAWIVSDLDHDGGFTVRKEA